MSAKTVIVIQHQAVMGGNAARRISYACLDPLLVQETENVYRIVI